MRPSDAALARSRAYALLGRLYLEELGPGLLREVGAVPELAAALGEAFDADEAAADFHHLFGLNVFPYASLFLDAGGRLGGPTTDHVRRLFREAGHPTDAAAESVDHVGHELGLLAFLAGAEADAEEDGLPAEAERMRRLQRRFFDAHLLWWLPAFALSLRRQRHAFYAALADLTLDLALDHRAALGGETAAVAAPLLPTPPPLLDDEATGLKEIAGYLATPAWSGCYLSRDDVARLGRREGLPRGFGGRALMLTNLLRAAVEFDRLAPLLALLADDVAAWRAHYGALAGCGVPPLAEVAASWLERLATTAQILERLRTAAASDDTRFLTSR